MLENVFSVYLLLLLLRPQEWLPSLQNLPILQLLLLACVVLWAIRGHKALALPQFPLLLWFVLATLVSAIAIGWLGSLAYQYQLLIPILLMFAVTTTVAQDLRILRRIMLIMIVSACVMVLHGHLQLEDGVGWTGMELMEGRITYVGIFDDPNDLGQLLVMCIAFCLYLRSGASTSRRLLLLGVVAWLSYGIYLTDSRGTFLAALAVFSIAIVRRFGRLALGILAAIAIPALALHTRLGEIGTKEQSASDRLDSWYQGFQMFLDSPLTGVGLGQYTEHNYLTAHNSIVLPMAELGILGFIPWFGMVAVTAHMVWWLSYGKHVPREPGLDAQVIEAEREAGYGLMLAAAGFAVSAFFLSTSYKHIFFLMMALVIARFYHARQLFSDAPHWSVSGHWPRLTAIAFGAIGCMWLLTHVLL
jgi:O-antigen ligase